MSPRTRETIAEYSELAEELADAMGVASPPAVELAVSDEGAAGVVDVATGDILGYGDSVADALRDAIATALRWAR